MNRTNEEIAVEWSEERQAVHIDALHKRRERGVTDDEIENGYQLVCVCRCRSEAYKVGNLLMDSARLKSIRKIFSIPY